MTTRHKLFATWKNQVGMGWSLNLAAVAESCDQHTAGRAEQVILEQLTVLFSAATDEPRLFVVAYEPAWAISTGSEPLESEPGEAGGRHGFIPEALTKVLGSATVMATTVLYGGSVTAANAASYLAKPDIDGGLVGKANESRPRSRR
jgi:triosephosphate isomerase